jgi:hypothetical protein
MVSSRLADFRGRMVPIPNARDRMLGVTMNAVTGAGAMLAHLTNPGEAIGSQPTKQDSSHEATGRRLTKVAKLYAHASQQIINLQSSPDVAAAACDAIVRRLCLGLWRFIGIKGSN